MPKDPGRHGSAYWKVRRQVLVGATLCAKCGGALSTSMHHLARSGHRASTTSFRYPN